VARRYFVGTLPIDVDDGHELDAGKRRENPGMVLPEVADPDDGNSDHGIFPLALGPTHAAFMQIS
jgi:hypothetical protein